MDILRLSRAVKPGSRQRFSPGRRLSRPATVVIVAIAAWLGLAGSEPARAAEAMRPAEPPPSQVLRLTLDEAMALFLVQNLEVLRAKFGIDAAVGRQITARLFPNPTLAVNTFSSYTQGCNISKCGAVAPSVSQLFEVAGRRGYRMEAAGLDTLSVEARFEDTVRQLGFTLKETYFRVLRQQGHLRVDQEVRDTLMRLLQGMPGDAKPGVMTPERIRLGLLAVDADVEVIGDLRKIEERSGDVRILLGISPDTGLVLTTELARRTVEPNQARLLEYALENRPDLRAKRLTRDKRKTELQLAKAIRYPNVTTNLGYMVQGPQGPDNQQQWTFNLSAPVPIFNRNQGGIVEAEVAVLVAETDVEKTVIQIQNEVTVAYRTFLFSRQLLDATQGALDRATELFRYTQQGFSKGKIGILDLENAHRSLGNTKENYIEALFGYEQAWLGLERAAGRDLMF